MDKEHQQIKALSERINIAQAPIRILDAIKWDDQIQHEFFKHDCKVLPKINKAYYDKHPLPFDPDQTITEFHAIIRAIKNDLGSYSNISKIMLRLCEEYIKAITMLKARGTALFSDLAMELYGAPHDAFYPGGPRLTELGTLLGDIFQVLTDEAQTELDEKKYSASEAVEILKQRFASYFNQGDQISVEVSDDMIADAAAGATSIKLNSHVKFSERDLKYLEVHEGWVHVGTTLNGQSQPYCTFLAKGSPSSSVTQEGLAVITEVFTFNSYPKRMLKITNRVRALDFIQDGANFIDIYGFFKDQGLNDQDSYQYSVRVFRGSTPDGGPFTKDLSYTKGFILIYNYFRLAVQQGKADCIPIFFVGKTLIEDISILYELTKQGVVKPPRYLPPQFRDLGAISSWLGFSLFLNKFDLEAITKHHSLF